MKTTLKISLAAVLFANLYACEFLKSNDRAQSNTNLETTTGVNIEIDSLTTNSVDGANLYTSAAKEVDTK